MQIVFAPVHFRAFFILENKLTGYADDSTLMAVVSSPGVRVALVESLICDLGVMVTLWWMHEHCLIRGVIVDGCYSKLVNVVSGVPQAVFRARHCSSCILRSCFPFWKISRSVMLMTKL